MSSTLGPNGRRIGGIQRAPRETKRERVTETLKAMNTVIADHEAERVAELRRVIRRNLIVWSCVCAGVAVLAFALGTRF